MSALTRLTTACGYLAAALLVLPCLLLPFENPDLWLHLRAGEWILRYGVPSTDPFSYTMTAQPWVDHEWCFQIAVYAVWRWAGWLGLVLFRAVCELALVLLLFRLVRRRLHLIPALSLIGMALMVLNTRFDLAPELVTLLCTALTAECLARRRRQPRHLWWLVPLQWLWANMHGYAIVGWLMTAWVLLGEALLLRVPWRWWGAEGRDPQMCRRLALLTVLQAVMIWLTPYGWRSWGYPAHVLQSLAGHERMLLGFIEELLPLISHVRQPGTWYVVTWFGLLLVTGLLSFLHRRRRPDVGVLIPWMLSALLGLAMVRHVALFAVMTTCAVGWNLEGWQPRRFGLGLSLAALGVAVWWSGVNFPLGLPIPRRVPVQAVNYLVDHQLPGALFNSFGFGGYLIFRVAPERKVFIDGRTELYGARFIREVYEAALTDPVAWEHTVARYGIRTALLDQTDWWSQRLLMRLAKDPGWRLLYADRLSAVFVRLTPAP